MKTNYKTYADIEERILDDNIICYAVTFTTTYDIFLFGKKIKTKTETEEVPFYFKSLEIAKDFCEIHPTYYKCYRTNDNYEGRYVYYMTYRINGNENNYYICWDYLIYDDDNDVNFYPSNYKIVNSFVSDIKLKDWMHTHCIDDIKYINRTLKLSDLIAKIENKNKLIKKWHFELVENNDKN